MSLPKEDRIRLMAAVGQVIRDELQQDKLESLVENVSGHNPWFISRFTKNALQQWAEQLRVEKLEKYASNFPDKASPVLRIGLVLAGNIPLVGFHDFLTVFLSGHHAMVKLSSKDEVLPKYIFSVMRELEPAVNSTFTLVDQLKQFDAVIATGSNNTSRYFKQYFAKVPNIIRQNRSSIAVLQKGDQQEQLKKLGGDAFMYFGLGCRNVSHLFIPQDFNLEKLIESLESWQFIANHYKYFNNYEYHKSVFLINREEHLDNGWCLFKEQSDLFSPISVLHYTRYQNLEDVEAYVLRNKEQIQCVISSSNIGKVESIPYGSAQNPDLEEFADGVDTREWLNNL